MADYNVLGGIELSYAKFRDKYLIGYVIAYFIVALFFLGALLALVGLPLLESAFAYNFKIGIEVMAGIAVAAVLLLLATIYLSMRVMRRGMKLAGISVAKMPKFIDWLVLSVRMCFVNAACWYDKKLLAPAAGALVLGALFLAVGAGALGFSFIAVAIIAWLFAVYAHKLRTFFSYYMLLAEGGSEGALPSKSHSIIQGKTFEVFMASYLMGQVASLAMQIVQTVSMLVFFVLGALVAIGGIGANISVIGAIVLLALVMLVAMVAISAFSMVYMAGVFAFFVKGSAAPAKKGGKKKVKKR